MEVVLVEQISNLKVELIVWWQNCVKSTKIKGQKVNSFRGLAHWRVVPLACI